MKRLSLLTALLAVFGVVLLTPVTATAVTDSPTANVWASYYYVSPTESVSESYRYNPTPDNPYAQSLCDQQECGRVVLVMKKSSSGKHSTVEVQKLPGEVMVNASYYYSADDGSDFSGSSAWNGSAIPVTKTVWSADKRKFVKLTLRSAYAEFYNPAFPELNY